MGILGDLDNPHLPQGPINNPFVRRQCCRVGYSSLSPFIRAPPFEKDYRLELRHLTSDLQKTLRSFETLQIDNNGFGLIVLSAVLENIALINIHFIAHPDDTRHAVVFSGHDITHCMCGEVSGLSYVRDISPGDFSQWEKARGKTVGCGSMT